MIRAAVAYVSAAALWGSLLSMVLLAAGASILGAYLILVGGLVTKLFGAVLLSFGIRLGFVARPILKGDRREERP